MASSARLHIGSWIWVSEQREELTVPSSSICSDVNTWKLVTNTEEIILVLHSVCLKQGVEAAVKLAVFNIESINVEVLNDNQIIVKFSQKDTCFVPFWFNNPCLGLLTQHGLLGIFEGHGTYMLWSNCSPELATLKQFL